MRILSPSHAKEVSHRAFNGRIWLIIPVNSEDTETPVARRGHPYLLDRTLILYIGQGKCIAGLNDNRG